MKGKTMTKEKTGIHNCYMACGDYECVPFVSIGNTELMRVSLNEFAILHKSAVEDIAPDLYKDMVEKGIWRDDEANN